MQYRRAKIPGGTYFFTVVTYRREKILCTPVNVMLLRQIFKKIMERHPFNIDAFVLLPDHLHCIWTLPQGDFDFSMRWRLIKSYFTRKCQKPVGWVEERHEVKPALNPTQSRPVGWVEQSETQQKISSRLKKKEQTIWQRRFWEHLIRDDQDLIRHVEYIHYNPVKHGLVKAPMDWEYSSFHRYMRDGVYNSEWGAGVEIKFDSEVGGE
jgi:putative transposase